MKKKFLWLKVVGACGLSLWLLAGCQTPDLKPFRDSTAKIQSGVVEAQDCYLEELQHFKQFAPDSSAYERELTRFTTNWNARVVVMEVMVKYASSLAALADAPGRGKAGLEDVAGAIKELGVVGGPYGAAVEGGVELMVEFKFLADSVRAARQIKKAVLATDENMQKLAGMLALDFARMRRTLEQIQGSIEYVMDKPFSQRLDARTVVLSRVNEHTRVMREKLGTNDWINAVSTFNQEMGEAHKYLGEADKWYVPHRVEVDAAKKRLTTHIALFRETEAALVQWGKAHGALARALQKDLSPDWTLLTQSAERMEKSIKKITDHEKN